ncbi:MAG: hypothetical protein V3W41_11715 [Planctomycetota bacterium]
MKIPTCFLAFWLAGLLSVALAKSSQQQVLMPTCDEFFLTIDPATAVGPTLGHIGRLKVRQGSGGIEELGYSVSGFGGILTGVGTFGPIIAFGDYLVEFFWFSSANGNMGGIQFIDLIGRFFPPNIGPNDYFGVRVSRADGGLFDFLGIFSSSDLAGDFLLGFELNSFADLANFQRIGAAQGAPFGPGAAGFFDFTPAASTISEIHFLDVAGVNPISFMGTNFAVTAEVTEVVFRDGTRWLTAADSAFMIDGTLSMSGSSPGLDLINLTDFSSTDAQVTFQSSATGSWSTNLSMVGSGTNYYLLSGAHRHRPRLVTDLESSDSPFPDLSATGEDLFDAVATGIGDNDPFYFTTRLGQAGGPRLNALFFGEGHRPSNEAHTGAAVISGGGLEFAAVNLRPGAEVFNLFALTSQAAPLGAGSFFGLPFGPEQLQQIFLPLGSAPIHVTADANGIYEWGVPAGTIPAGLVIDGATVALPLVSGDGFRISSVLRLVF